MSKGIKALRKAKLTFSAVEAGTLAAKVFATSAGPSAAKRVLVASGRKRFAAAGKGTVRLRLTKAGKRLARRAKPPKLALAVRFAPTSGPAVSVTVQAKPKARKAAAWRVVMR